MCFHGIPFLTRGVSSPLFLQSYEGSEEVFPAEMLRDGVLAEGSNDEFPGSADFPEPAYIPR